MVYESFTLPDGRVVPARPVGFTTLCEEFSEYLTDDHTLIRVKHVATQILESETVDATGQRSYAVLSQAVLSASTPGEF